VDSGVDWSCAAIQRIWTERRVGWRGIWWGSTRASVESCTWGGIMACISTGWELICWTEALQRRTRVSWWPAKCPWASSGTWDIRAHGLWSRLSPLPCIKSLYWHEELWQETAEHAACKLCVSQRAVCGVCPINVRCQSKSSRDTWAGSAATLRHPPQRAPSRNMLRLKSGSMESWDCSQSSGLGIWKWD